MRARPAPFSGATALTLLAAYQLLADVSPCDVETRAAEEVGADVGPCDGPRLAYDLRRTPQAPAERVFVCTRHAYTGELHL